MTRLIPALLFALVAGACATQRTHTASQSPSPSSSPAAQAGNGKGTASNVLCRTERPTGSNIMTRVCYSEDELDAMAPAAQETLRRAIQAGTVQKERN